MALQLLAVFTEDQHVGEGALRRALLLIEEARSIADTHAADVAIVDTRQDLERVLASPASRRLRPSPGSPPTWSVSRLPKGSPPISQPC